MDFLSQPSCPIYRLPLHHKAGPVVVLEVGCGESPFVLAASYPSSLTSSIRRRKRSVSLAQLKQKPRSFNHSMRLRSQGH